MSEDAGVAGAVAEKAKRALWYVISENGADVGLIEAAGPADAVGKYMNGKVTSRKAEIEDAIKLSVIEAVAKT